MTIERVLITGGATGLGKALAFSWLKHGQAEQKQVKICIADIHDERGEETVAALQQAGAEAMYCHCDIRNVDEIKQVQAKIHEAWHGLDVVMNNAGVATGGSFASEPLSQWQWVFDINLFGMVQVSQVFLDDFKKQGSGKIINIASQAGITPIPMMASYNSVKSAVVGLSETLKLELANDNIDVHVVCPSFFKTHLGESLRSTEASPKIMVDRVFEKAQMTAEQVADSVYKQQKKGKFLILTHKEGRLAYMMKKWLPFDTYLNRVIKATSKLVKSSIVANEKAKKEQAGQDS